MKKQPPKKSFGKGLVHDKPGTTYIHQYRLLGAMALSALPNTDFFAGHPLAIKNQGPYNFCFAFAKDAVVEDEVGIELDPLYSVATACELIGEVEVNGMSLDDICKQETQVGAIEAGIAPYKVEEGRDAAFLANWLNYPDSFKPLAWEHQRPAAVRVDTGPHDTFDNIRAAMYQNIDEHRSVLTGVMWRDSWTNAPKGFIPANYDPTEPGDGHAIKIFGQMNINGVLYLVCQNSWGTDVGDGGLFYFPREVVNAEFTFGAFSFKNIPPAKAQFHSDNNIPLNAGFFAKWWGGFKGIITSYFK